MNKTLLMKTSLWHNIYDDIKVGRWVKSYYLLAMEACI